MMPLQVLRTGEMTILNYIFKKRDINGILFFGYSAAVSWCAHGNEQAYNFWTVWRL